MADPWFFFAALAHASGRLSLSGEEATHAGGARRLRAGDRVVLFDGAGTVANAQIAATAAGRVELTLLAREQQPLLIPLHLACALPKGDRQATLLDTATQLGMTDFTPLACEHSVVAPGPNSVPRWQRICLEACKQSRRAYLPRLHATRAPAELAREHGALTLLIAHPDGQTFTHVSARLTPAGAMLLIGPEGGFTPQEVAAVRAAGGGPVALGGAILRVETAAAALLALVAERLRNTD
jgi:16S rRNA (uracil1498-N3)-methyltransferase